MTKRNFNEWLSTFRESIADYKYYIDFDNVYNNLNEFKIELNILNSLVGSNDIENDFNSHIQQNWKQEELKTMLTEYDKNILVFLNEFLYAERNKLKFTFNNSVNVEHIMPQSGINIATIMKDAKIEDKNEFKAVVNKLGNKLLLEESINKSISNEWFKTKKTTSVKNKTGYKDSKYYIAQNMVKFPKDIWTVNDIEERTEKIADEIVNFIFTGKI